jgi:hypothetical protein
MKKWFHRVLPDKLQANTSDYDFLYLFFFANYDFTCKDIYLNISM